jgi:transcriptional regulator with XRE-family HTH domain
VPVAAPKVILTLATSIRSLRLRGGWSQRDLAARMSVPRTYISKLENEKASPTLSSLEKLARALEVTVPELFSGEESSRRDTIAALMCDPFVAAVAAFVSRLNAVQMSSVLAAAHDMTMRQQRRDSRLVLQPVGHAPQLGQKLERAAV